MCGNLADAPLSRRPAYHDDCPRGPSYDFRIDLATKEKRPADVVKWYDAWVKDKTDRYGGAGPHAERVADAVLDEFPQRALDVYRQGADRALVHTGDGVYREAMKYLRKVKDLLGKLGQAGEWQAYETQIREPYKRRRNFIQLPDCLGRDRIAGGRGRRTAALLASRSV